MAKREVEYFEENGPQNTQRTLEIALQTAQERNINYMVIASGGSTILKAAEMVAEKNIEDISLVGVTLQAGTWEKYGEPDWNKIEKAKDLGADILTCTHALMGNVESAVKDKFGGIPPAELIAYTYYTFSQGTKVTVEITMNAVDAGLVPAGEKVIAVAGSDEGADTALLLKSVSTVDFFDLRIHEILCKPE
ncbi:MAG: hypothetical protein ACOC4G_03845 [Bacillota bacterium]